MSGNRSYQGELPKSESDSGKLPVDADHDALDSDAAKLAGMGYTQDMERSFNKWSLLGGKFSNILFFSSPLISTLVSNSN